MISVTEIVLIVAGFAAVIIGFFLPAGREDSDELLGITEREIRERVDDAISDYRSKLDSMADDAAEEGINRAERALERLTNEKMDALGEYSNSVMNEVNRNHNEVVFLYEMLNDKQKSLKTTVSEVNKTADEARQTAQEAQRTINEAREGLGENRVVRPEPEAYVELAAKREELIAERAKESVQPAFEEFDGSAFSRLTPEEEARIIRQQTAPTAVDGVDDQVGAGVDPVKEGKLSDPGEAAGNREMLLGSQISSRDDIREAEALKSSAGTKNPAKGMTVATSKIVSISEGSRRRGQETDPVMQNKRIIDMHNAGKSNMVIARELGLGIGEVKLVIDLSEKQRRVAK